MPSCFSNKKIGDFSFCWSKSNPSSILAHVIDLTINVIDGTISLVDNMKRGLFNVLEKIAVKPNAIVRKKQNKLLINTATL